jgi:hypothetical protein
MGYPLRVVGTSAIEATTERSERPDTIFVGRGRLCVYSDAYASSRLVGRNGMRAWLNHVRSTEEECWER